MKIAEAEIKKLAQRAREYMARLDIRSSRFVVAKGLKYRKEHDGRILCFSPVTGKISVLNPTMAAIYEEISKKPGLKFDDIVESLCAMYPETSYSKISHDTERALTWLFINGYIKLNDGNDEEKYISFMEAILREGLKNEET
ncbi:hypothetical protein DRO91_04320 [Candidatus Heimdallarchaeota archaeon]|nr:MAG: hypothetical protein DRO91_04320 [Candidatus Heimdallarchaeota archaeon]